MPQFEIKSPKQIIVEGQDDARLFLALLNHVGTSDVQISDCGGIRSLELI